jgi:hypothetical protein
LYAIRAAVLALICAVALSVANADSSFAATAGAYELTKAPRTVPRNDSVTVIGDSVTLGAERFARMQKRLAQTTGISWCDVDSRGSRQLAAGVKLARQLKKKGKLGNIVVYSLTTNGSFGYKEAKAAFKAVGKDRYVVFVTGYVKGYSYFQKSNEAVRELAKEERRVLVADWNKFIVKKKYKHLSDDYCHLSSTSGRWYVDIVKKAVREARVEHIAAYKKKLSAKARPSSAATVNLAVGASARAPAAYWGAYIGDRKLFQTSGNPAVVSVDADGYMTANAPGTAVVTVSDDAKPEKRKRIGFTVNVAEAAIVASGLDVRTEKINRWAVRLIAAPTPANATGVPVFSTSNKEVAKVNRAGVVMGKKAGKAKISVRFGRVVKTVNVRVK